MIRSTLTWVLLNDLMVSFATPGAVADDTFQRWLEDFSSKPFTKYLVTTAGVTHLNSVQRKAAAEVLSRRTIEVAVVTDDVLVRGIATAVSWLGVKIKPFPWTELRTALKYLRVSPVVEDRAIDALSRMKGTAIAPR